MDNWDAHVWDAEGKWVGQFYDEATARAWVAGRPGFTIDKIGPTEKKRLAEAKK